ncbi:putative protein phosphatase 2C 27 [Platanthera zijinensis]|uniref:Uncharacterized protein n=1 Tax=Platanthera zijinensis TaxID=2320716 RepID=A0AAP0AVA3_9ASPA
MLEGRHGGKESDSSLYAEGIDSPWRMEQNGIWFYFSLMSILVSTHGLSFLQDSDLGFLSLSSLLDDKSGFLPVFRAGICSEIGPKLYMEDEYICIDNIVDHLCADADLPAPCAFYGVRFIFKSIFWGMSILCAHGGNV